VSRPSGSRTVAQRDGGERLVVIMSNRCRRGPAAPGNSSMVFEYRVLLFIIAGPSRRLCVKGGGG
jgi:hypothetical protein